MDSGEWPNYLTDAYSLNIIKIQKKLYRERNWITLKENSYLDLMGNKKVAMILMIMI